jgi:hypothetical protein
MENYSIANLGEVVLSLSDDRSSFFYLKDIGLDVAIGSRDQLTTLDETWNNAGIYILLSNIVDNKFDFYIGKSISLSGRVEKHKKTKSFWDRFIFFKSSVSKGFTSTDISYLESQLILTLRNWPNAKSDNIVISKEDSISDIQKEIMENIIRSIINILRFLGFTMYVESDDDLIPKIQDSYLSVKNKYWVVRAGKGSQYTNIFFENGYVAIDFSDTYSKSLINVTKKNLIELEQSGNAATQLLCFRDKISIGDLVIVPYKNNEKYAILKITSDYIFSNNKNQYVFPHIRKAEAIKIINRDQIDDNLFASLRTVLTVYSPKNTKILDTII